MAVNRINTVMEIFRGAVLAKEVPAIKVEAFSNYHIKLIGLSVFFKPLRAIKL